MQKIEIRNRKSEKMVVVLQETKQNKGIVFIMHGLGYNKEESSIKACSKAFEEKGYTTIRFDTTNTFGESFGSFENATATNYYEDLEDVISWAKKNSWYREPFFLAGQSLGGLCTILYAEKYPEKIKGVIGISSIISGELFVEVYPKEIIEFWKKNGFLEWEDQGIKKKLKWNCIQDGLKYDSLKNINSLNSPTLLIVGEKDDNAPVKHQKLLYDKILCKKELKIINNAGHMFREEKHLKELKSIIFDWLDELSGLIQK